MRRIKDSFCGRVIIDQSEFICSVSGHIVTVLPATKDDIEKLMPYTITAPEFIYGIDVSGFPIAFLLTRNIQASSFFPRKVARFFSYLSARFFTPLIIRGISNPGSYGDIKEFDAISFAAGAINTIYNPKIAALEPVSESDILIQDGARTIKVKPFDDYTHTAAVEIDGEKAKLLYSVYHSGEDGDTRTPFLGTLTSMIRLEFNNPQDILKIRRYYSVIHSLLAFCVRQNNVGFEVTLHRKLEGRYHKTEECKIDDGYEDYCEREYHTVIPITGFQNYLAKLIELICDGDIDHLTALLPESNKRLQSINITNVQDICTALEIEYRLCDSPDKLIKDTFIGELKKDIRATIKKFVSNHPEIDVDTETTIGSCFNHLDLTLREKIAFLYGKHQAVIDPLIIKKQLPTIDAAGIGEFVKLRNKKTHTGKVEWNESADLYIIFLALVYACVMQRIGLSEDEIGANLSPLF